MKEQAGIRYDAGSFHWVELATTDADAGREFYRELFGWEFRPNPDGEHGGYERLALESGEIGGLCQVPPTDAAGPGWSPQWRVYLSVPRADEAAAAIVALKGRVLEGPYDVSEVGKMALIEDPTGAVFGLREAGAHGIAGTQIVPGSLVWHELATADLARAADFYSRLFGWVLEPADADEATYARFIHREVPLAAMIPIVEAGRGVQPHWMPYFAVEDRDEAVHRAVAAGGEHHPVTEVIPGEGLSAVMRDPQGAWFGLLQV